MAAIRPCAGRIQHITVSKSTHKYKREILDRKEMRGGFKESEENVKNRYTLLRHMDTYTGLARKIRQKECPK
jgi:hypothetical protein